MQRYRKHIVGIVDELMNNSIKARAQSIDVHVEAQETEVMIEVVDNGDGMNEERLQEVRRKLAQPRRDELEEYYGALAGESNIGSGLTLVGMMTDRAEVDSRPGQGTRVAVYRKMKPRKEKKQ